MSEEVARVASILALIAAGAFGAWTYWACRREPGISDTEAQAWLGLGAVFLLLSQIKLARALGLSLGLGEWLRVLAKQHNLYADRRPIQIIASIAVVVIVAVVFLYGLIWIWDHIKRYRVAIGFAALAVGFAVIRFISLHEVDAWNAAMPWARSVIDLAAAAGVSAVAFVKLGHLKALAEKRRQSQQQINAGP